MNGGNATGFDWHSGGLALGADAQLAPGTVIGAAFGYERSNIDLDDDAGNGQVRSRQFSLYGAHASGAWQWRAIAGYADPGFETSRNILIGGSRSGAAENHDGDLWSAYAEGDYTIPFATYRLQPLLGFNYVNLREAGYAETGGAAALAVNARSTESETSLLGVRYERPLAGGGLELRAVWVHEFGDVGPLLTERLVTVPAGGSFMVTGSPLGRNALTLGGGVSDRVAGNILLYADANAELRTAGQTQYELQAGLRYNW